MQPKTCLTVVAALIAFAPCIASAEILHHWRFEEGAFLVDSVGEATLSTSSSSTFPRVELPRLDQSGQSDGGNSFPSAFAGVGPNRSALERLLPRGELIARDTIPVAGDFTIELFTHIDDFSVTNTAAVLASQVSKPNARGTSWTFQIRMDGFQGLRRGELTFVNSDGSSFRSAGSGIVLNEHADYYLAGSFDLDGGSATYYIKDLTNETPLQIVPVDHSMTSLNPSPVFLVGGRAAFSVDGLIDEVRFSNHLLSVDELLINNVFAGLQAGDADQDFDFDQLDLVQVQIAAKYLNGQAATWGEGDWNGAPGGSPNDPPDGDGLFNQLDIVAAQQAGIYLTGAYAVVGPSGRANDGQTSIVYNVGTGELAVDTPAGTELTSINIDSAAGIFTGESAHNLGGSFDNDADSNIFKATFGSSFGALSFGNVAQEGLSEDFVLNDLTVVGSLAGGGDLGTVDLIYVPEPSSLALALLSLFTLGWSRRRKQ